MVADFYLDGLKVAESRHLFTESGASDAGPTYAWLKAPIPIENPTGTAEVRVFAAPAGKKERLLFVRKAVVTN